jgi:transposase
LSPIQHRGPEAQADLAVIRARAELVDGRTGLINCARGLAKRNRSPSPSRFIKTLDI